MFQRNDILTINCYCMYDIELLIGRDFISIIWLYLSKFDIYLGDRDRFCLPEDVTILHAEFTYYYYPGDITFPRKKIYVNTYKYL